MLLLYISIIYSIFNKTNTNNLCFVLLIHRKHERKLSLYIYPYIRSEHVVKHCYNKINYYRRLREWSRWILYGWTSSGYNVSASTDPLAAFTHIQKYPNTHNILLSDWHKTVKWLQSAYKNQRLNNKIKVILIRAHEYIEDNWLNFELFQIPIPL